MTSKIKKALAELEKLSADEQDLAADALLDFAQRERQPQLSADQAKEVEARLADPKPTFITLAEARARLSRLGA